jgi:hypothetical protein
MLGWADIQKIIFYYKKTQCINFQLKCRQENLWHFLRFDTNFIASHSGMARRAAVEHLHPQAKTAEH